MLLSLVACIFAGACGEDEPASRDLKSIYAGLASRYFRTPDGGRIAAPWDIAIGEKLVDQIRSRYDDAQAMAKEHVALLAKEPDDELRFLARLALASWPQAVRFVLEQELWRKSTAQGRREIAALLGSARSLTVADILARPAATRDPVLLFALMVKTGHTYGAPPKLVIEDATDVPEKTRTHWERWLREEWPRLKALDRSERGRVERESVQKMWESSDEATRRHAWERYASAKAVSLEQFKKMLDWNEALRRKAMAKSPSSAELWGERRYYDPYLQ